MAVLLTDGYPDTTASETLACLDELMANSKGRVVIHTIAFECDDHRARQLMATVAERTGGVHKEYPRSLTEQQHSRGKSGEGVWKRLCSASDELLRLNRSQQPQPTASTLSSSSSTSTSSRPPQSNTPSLASTTVQSTAHVAASRGGPTRDPPSSPQKDLVQRHSAALKMADNVVGPLLGWLSPAAAADGQDKVESVDGCSQQVR